MRWRLPHSLGGRTALLVIVAVLLMQLLTLVSLAHLRMQVIEQQGMELARAYLVLGRSALQHMPPEQFAQALAQQTLQLPAQNTSPIRLIHHPRLSEQQYVSSVGMTLLYQQLRRAWGSHQVAISTDPDERLLLRLQGDWWIQILSVSHQDVDRIGAVLLWMLLGILLVGVLIAFFVTQLVRPILKIEQGVQHFAQGGSPPVFGFNAPHEIARLASSLEQMMQAIRQHEHERRTLLSGLPHDLRAPLTRLKLRATLLGQNQHTQAMQHDIHAITHLADQFVAYLHGLDLQVHREPVELVGFLQQVVEGYQQTGREVQLRSELALLMVSLDLRLWRRLLDNMIENACHHGQPPIVVGIQAEPEDIRFWIEDHGKGIDDGDLSTALQPFAQLNQARGVGGQVGLGLSIIQQILQAHGYRYQFDRGEAGGLRLQVWLTHTTHPHRADRSDDQTK